jgi:hypothetical protein
VTMEGFSTMAIMHRLFDMVINDEQVRRLEGISETRTFAQVHRRIKKCMFIHDGCIRLACICSGLVTTTSERLGCALLQLAHDGHAGSPRRCRT